MMRKVSVGLVVAGYAVLLYTSLAAPAYARAHMHLDASMRAEYAGPWPVALAVSLSISGIMLALIPIRHGERWAIWTSLVTLMILLGTRMATDPRCLLVLDPHQHGCHTLMIAVLLGVIGLLLARFGRPKAESLPSDRPL
jgi:hypothetical protein